MAVDLFTQPLFLSLVRISKIKRARFVAHQTSLISKEILPRKRCCRHRALASIPDSEKPEEYKPANLALEGTSYEYPQRRLTTSDAGSPYKIRGKTREEALSSRRTGDNLASSKLWILYEFAPFHGGGVGSLFGSSVTEYNNPDDGSNWSVPDGARVFLYLDGHVENK